jgi:hypothetical protein
MNTTRCLFTLGLILAALGPSGGLATAQTRDPEALFREANTLYKQRKLEAARKLYEEVWALRKTHDVAANLGNVELELGAFRPAAEHLRAARALFPLSAKADKRAQLETVLAKAMAEVGVVVVDVLPDSARVSVDGRDVPRESWSEGVVVDPGARDFTAVAEGYAPITEMLALGKGTRLTWTVRLHAEAPPVPTVASSAPVPSASAPPVAPAVERWPTWPVYAGAAAAVVAVGVGGVFYGLGSGAEDDAQSAFDDAVRTGRVCVGGCADLRDGFASADGKYDVGTALFVTGGVLGVATLGYALLWSGEPRGGASNAIRVVPQGNATGMGVTAVGQF